MSGMRKEPPISTSSPRETTDSLSFASAESAEDDRRGVVVDRERRLRAREAAEEPFDVVVALPALAAVERVFERVVGARDFVDRFDRLFREQRTAEVRVYHDAGRVDDAAQAVLRAAREQAARVGCGCVRVEGRVAVFDYLRALGREQVGEQRLHRLSSEPLFKFRYPRKREQLVHRRDVSHYFLYLCVQGNSLPQFMFFTYCI